MYNFLLLALLCIICSSSNFHTTVQLLGSTINIPQCRSNDETFKKGTRCCYSLNNNGIIDKCSPKDASNQCITDNRGNSNPYQFYDTYDDAKTACENMGRRLCTVAEYETLCGSTGCGVDFLEAWTSDTCEPFFKAYADINRSPKTVTLDGETDLGAIRCCTLAEGGANSFCEADRNGETCWYNEPFFNGYTNLNVNNQERVSYTEAAKFCESIGRRLCDYQVLKIRTPDTASTNDNNFMRGCVGTGCETDKFYVWSRDTVPPAPTYSPTGSPTQVPTGRPTYNNILDSGDSLNLNGRLYSPSGSYYADLELGGLVVYEVRGTNPTEVWRTNIGRNTAFRLDMEQNNNLVLVDSSFNQIWSSDTDGQGQSGGFLELRDNGDLVIVEGGTYPDDIWTNN